MVTSDAPDPDAVPRHQGRAPGATETDRVLLRALLFDDLPPTWVLDTDGRILEANAPGRAITAAGRPVCIEDGRLIPAIAGGERRFRQTVANLAGPARFAWPTASGSEAALRLRPLPDAAGIAATLMLEPDPVADVAPRLARELALPRRQSELGAHLLAGHPLTEAAAAMGIARNTANEYLAAMQRRLGVSTRPALLGRLLAVQR